MYQVTRWRRPSYIIETTDGIKRYDDWCEKELVRLGEKTHKISWKKSGRSNNLLAIFKKEE